MLRTRRLALCYALLSYSLREQFRQGDTDTWCACSAETHRRCSRR